MIEKDIHIVNELAQLSPSLIAARVDSRLLFSVPANYFDNLSTNILHAIAAENLQQSIVPYQVQAGYFDNLSNTILNKIANERTVESAVDSELQAFAPILATINKANIYSVPNGYFENLQIDNNPQKNIAKVVPFKGLNTWIKYAIAACVVGVLVTNAYLFTNKNATVDYAAYKKIDVASSISTVSSDELASYLDNANAIANNEIVNLIDEKMPETQEHIKDISEDDLKQYLNEVNLLVTEAEEEI